MSTNETNVGTRIIIIYRDSNGNEHDSYEAACIAQVLLDNTALYIESYKLRAIAEVIANYFYPKQQEQAVPEEAAFIAAAPAFEQEEQLHG